MGKALPLRKQAKSKFWLRLGLFYLNKNQHKQLSWDLTESSSVLVSCLGLLICQQPVLNPIARASPGSQKTLFPQAREGPGEGQSGSRSSEHLSIHNLVTTLLILPSSGVLSSQISSGRVEAALVLPAQTLVRSTHGSANTICSFLLLALACPILTVQC